MSEERYMLHLLVSRENGAQLVAIPFGMDDVSGIKQFIMHNPTPSRRTKEELYDALDAALRETSE